MFNSYQFYRSVVKNDKMLFHKVYKHVRQLKVWIISKV